MRRFYAFIFTLFTLCVVLFIGAFVYLEREKHRAFHYIVNVDGADVGTIKVDRYATEDKILYRSVSSTPFDPVYTSSKSKMALNTRYALESYTRKTSGNGVSEDVYMENRSNKISFIAISRSEFTSLSDMPIKDTTFVFNEDYPMTYLPIIENYDFRRGRSQGFNAITHFSFTLPPMKRFVTLTSIKTEPIIVDSKKIKAEYLLLKIRNYPQGIVWVSSHDKSLLKIEIPARRLTISRVYEPRALEAKDYLAKGDGYISKDVSFKNKNIQLSGLLYAPKYEGKFPAILLASGDGGQDMRNEGLFTSMAERLARGGFAVLIYDKRGVGSSGGNWDSATDADNIEDINTVLDFLKSQSQADPNRLFVAGHMKGALYAARAASARGDVKAVVMLSPAISNDTAASTGWSDEYVKLADKARRETADKVKSTDRKWAFILNRRCFLAKMREAIASDPAAAVSGLGIPVLIIQGKGAAGSGIEAASIIDQALETSGNVSHILMYFSYLDSFLGKRVADGIHKIHYEVDAGVLKAVSDWLTQIHAPNPVDPAGPNAS